MSRGVRLLLVLLVLLPGLFHAGFRILDQAAPLPLAPWEAPPPIAVLAHDGQLLRAFPDQRGLERRAVTLAEASPLYLQALLGYEDRFFHLHPGVNPFALLRAAWQWLAAGRPISGGSTLTMQLARLLEPHPRTLAGKARQMFRAMQLEARFTKDELLTLYLNHAPFGGVSEGVWAGSMRWLGHPPDRISHGEAALLAVLPQAPSRLRPDRNPAGARAARDKALRRLADLGVWPPRVVQEAFAERIHPPPPPAPVSAPILARRLSVQALSARESDAWELVDSQGLIRTTLDADLQRRLEGLAAAWTGRLPPRTSLAILVVENANLAARAYIGSADFFDAQRQGQVDMIQAIRSPGSTLKPFLYGLALDDGLVHSESLLTDAPLTFGDYRPGNFRPGFSGPVGLAEALQRSLNVPAVQLLAHLGPRRFWSRLRHAGLPLFLPRGAQPNLAMILGGVGVRLESLAGAYRALAWGGRSGIVRFTPDAPLRERRLLSPGAAWIVRRLLRERPGDGPGWGDDRGGLVAWKTGTSYGFRDAWAMGVTPTFTVGVWVGRPDGAPIPGHYGAADATPLLMAAVDRLPLRGWAGADDTAGATTQAAPPPRTSDTQAAPPPRTSDTQAAPPPRTPESESPADPPSALAITAPPPTVARAEICWPLGGPPEPEAERVCHERRQAWILDGRIPPTLPDLGGGPGGLRRRIWINPATGLRANRACRGIELQPRTLALWPLMLRAWPQAARHGGARAPAPDPLCPPGAFPAAEAIGAIVITGLQPGQILQPAGPGRPLPEVDLDALGGTGRRYWFVNGRLAGQTPPGVPLHHRFDQTGAQQVTVMDESGHFDRMIIQIENHPIRPMPDAPG